MASTDAQIAAEGGREEVLDAYLDRATQAGIVCARRGCR